MICAGPHKKGSNAKVFIKKMKMSGANIGRAMAMMVKPKKKVLSSSVYLVKGMLLLSNTKDLLGCIEVQ